MWVTSFHSSGETLLAENRVANLVPVTGFTVGRHGRVKLVIQTRSISICLRELRNTGPVSPHICTILQSFLQEHVEVLFLFSWWTCRFMVRHPLEFEVFYPQFDNWVTDTDIMVKVESHAGHIRRKTPTKASLCSECWQIEEAYQYVWGQIGGRPVGCPRCCPEGSGLPHFEVVCGGFGVQAKELGSLAGSGGGPALVQGLRTYAAEFGASFLVTAPLGPLTCPILPEPGSPPSGCSADVAGAVEGLWCNMVCF